jgi:hypothetical protein
MTRDHLNPELSQRRLLRSACSSREVALAANPGVRLLPRRTRRSRNLNRNRERRGPNGDNHRNMTAMNRIILRARARGVSRHPSADRCATAIRWAAAIVFVVFGAGKFVNHPPSWRRFANTRFPHLARSPTS